MKDLKVVAKGNMSLVLSSEKMGKVYKCIPHSSTLCKPSCQSLKQEAEILSRLVPSSSQSKVSFQKLNRERQNENLKCTDQEQKYFTKQISKQADLLTYQEEFPSLDNPKKNKNQKQKQKPTQLLPIPENQKQETSENKIASDQNQIRNLTKFDCFINPLGPLRQIKTESRQRYNQKTNQLQNNRNQTIINDNYDHISHIFHNDKFENKDDQFVDIFIDSENNDDNNNDDECENFMQSEGQAILDFIKRIEGYDLDLNICLIELEIMHCDYLDFLNVKPPLINKISIFEGVVEALEIFHNQFKIAHNDVRLPNLFLNKIQNQVENYHFQNMAGSFEGEEFWNFRGVLGDFGFSGMGQQIFEKMTKTHLSPEALRSKNDKKVTVDLHKNDVFALGICIFWACFGFYPYENLDKREEDILFKKLYSQNDDDFWQTTKIHRVMKKMKSETNKEFVEQLKNLLKKMLHPVQEQRINIKGVQEHDIFQKVLHNYQQQYIQHAGLQRV